MGGCFDNMETYIRFNYIRHFSLFEFKNFIKEIFAVYLFDLLIVTGHKSDIATSEFGVFIFRVFQNQVIKTHLTGPQLCTCFFNFSTSLFLIGFTFIGKRDKYMAYSDKLRICELCGILSVQSLYFLFSRWIYCFEHAPFFLGDVSLL